MVYHNLNINSLLQVCLALRFLASGSIYSTVGDTQGVDKSTVCRSVDAFVKWLCSVRGRCVKNFYFPTLVTLIFLHLKLVRPGTNLNQLLIVCIHYISIMFHLYGFKSLKFLLIKNIGRHKLFPYLSFISSCRYIKWPKMHEMPTHARKWYDIANFPRVIGAVDGTHIPIRCPDVRDRNYFCRKEFHSLNVMVRILL